MYTLDGALALCVRCDWIQYLVTLSFLRQFTCNHIIQLNLSQLLEHSVPVEVRMAKSTRNDKRKKSVEFWKLLFKRRDGTFFIYICVSAPLMSPMHVCTLFSRDARSKCSLNRGMRWNAVEWETIGRLSEESNKVEKMPIIMTKEIKRVEWAEVEKISKSDDKSQASIQ